MKPPVSFWHILLIRLMTLRLPFFVSKFVDMNRIQCGCVPKRKYSVSDESVNSTGKEMVLLWKETFLKVGQKLKMLSESK